MTYYVTSTCRLESLPLAFFLKYVFFQVSHCDGYPCLRLTLITAERTGVLQHLVVAHVAEKHLNNNNSLKFFRELLLFSAYLPIQKDPRCTRVWNLPVDVQIIQRAGVGITDMLVDPAFVQLAEVGFREDGAAFELVHSGAEQVLHIMHRNDYRRTGRVKCAEQILAVAAHGALAVAALEVDGVAPVTPCGAQELAEMRIRGSKTGNGQNITPILNCAQCNNSAQFL